MLVIISNNNEYSVKLYIKGVEKILYASTIKELIKQANDYYKVNLLEQLN